MQTEKPIMAFSIVTAIAASLCCITPAIAFLAGIGGFASTFSWMEPIRPLLIGLTILALGIAWFLRLRPVKETNCACDDKPQFVQSKTFLSIITIFAATMLAFPYYSFVFFPNPQAKATTFVSTSDISSAQLTIQGMTCSGCEEHILHVIREIDGIISSEASYKTGTAKVVFNKSKTSLESITTVINSIGYQVIHSEPKDN